MNRLKQHIGEGRAIFASVLCLSSFVLLAPSAVAKPEVPTITVVKAQQRYPWNGKVDISYTVSGLQAAAEGKGLTPYLTVMAIDRATTPWTTNVADLACLSLGTDAKTAFTDAAATTDGTHQLVWDLDKQGLSLLSDKVVFAVQGDDDVQLWKDGPFWATCNVGADKPQDYGYYFWWGDTVGYKRNAANDGWNSVDGKRTGFQFKTENCPTDKKDNDALKKDGYIDGTGNLVAAYDAATQRLGAPWRMPTETEIVALTNYCTSVWTEDWNKTGVKGRVVTGKGAYSGRSIFLPAAGNGYGSSLNYAGKNVHCWSSTPTSDSSSSAWYLTSRSDSFNRSFGYRYYGRSVRPLRGFANATTFCTGVSEPVCVDQTVGTRRAQATETLTYSPKWYSAEDGLTATVKIDGGVTLVNAATAGGTYAWSTLIKSGTYTLQHETYQDGTLKDTLTATFEVVTVEVTTNDAAVAGTTVAVTDEAGKPLVAQAGGELIVPTNSMVTVTWTATEGKYFADGSTTYAQSFKADKSVNPAGEAVVKPGEAKAPTVQLGKVAQRYPWDGRIDVEYKVSNVPANVYKLEVTAECGGLSCAAYVDDVKSGTGTAVITTKGEFAERVSKNCRVSAKLVEKAPPK